MATQAQQNLQTWINQRENLLLKSLSEKQQGTRHKCFVSFHHADEMEVKQFIESFENAFIPLVLGVSNEDDFIDSKDTEYVMDQIQEKYLTGSTVTIVLVGKCTWARRYVDWEVAATLRNDKKNGRSGLMAVTLPSADNYVGKRLPPRVRDNVTKKVGYARWYKYTASEGRLQSWIDEAFDATTTKAHLINNTRERKINNSQCL